MAKKERFEKVYSQGAVNIMEIWMDKETGVNYVFHASGYAGGMTPLLDRDGKPVISPIVNQVNSSCKNNILQVFITPHRVLIKSSKHLENKGFIAISPPYPFI